MVGQEKGELHVTYEHSRDRRVVRNRLADGSRKLLKGLSTPHKDKDKDEGLEAGMEENLLVS